MSQIDTPNMMVRYVNSNGTLTVEGMKLFQQLVATLKDHEDRVTALEP